MDKRITARALIAASLLGNVYWSIDAMDFQRTDVVRPTLAADVELVAAAVPVKAKMLKAGDDVYTCRMAVSNSTNEGLIGCRNTGNGTFWLNARQTADFEGEVGKEASLVIDANGKVIARPAATEG